MQVVCNINSIFQYLLFPQTSIIQYRLLGLFLLAWEKNQKVVFICCTGSVVVPFVVYGLRTTIANCVMENLFMEIRLSVNKVLQFCLVSFVSLCYKISVEEAGLAGKANYLQDFNFFGKACCWPSSFFLT